MIIRSTGSSASGDCLLLLCWLATEGRRLVEVGSGRWALLEPVLPGIGLALDGYLTPLLTEIISTARILASFMCRFASLQLTDQDPESG